MKTIAVHMPQMGQSAAEGTIVKWHKKTGELVQTDEVLVEVESDKINIEVESPVTGRLSGCIKVGRTVPVGEVIAMIESEDASEPKPAEPAEAKPAGADKPHMGTTEETDQEVVSTKAMPDSIDDAVTQPDYAREWLSPSVLRLAMMNDISLDQLRMMDGTGKDGRVTRSDVLNAVARQSGAAALPPDPHGNSNAGADDVMPMSSIRRTIADHMVQSIHTSAHVTMVHAVDMTALVALREKVKEAFKEKHGTRMSYTAVMTYAVARVLRDFPSLNASVAGTNIVRRQDVHIGCAVALSDESLVVPVVQDADKKSFTEISLDLQRLIQLARTKSLSRDDISDGTFTLSNFGAFGSLIGTPIINQPQVAILGMGAIFKAPTVVDGEICIRDTMYLSLSFDHRVIDGAMGGRFLHAIQRTTEGLDEDVLDLSTLT